MNYWRQLGRMTGPRKMYAVQCDRHGLRPGDAVEVTMREGGTEQRIVRKVLSVQPEGDLCLMCPRGTPEVRRPNEANDEQP